MGVKSKIDELNMVVGGYLKSFQHALQDENYPIDFVVTWVDGNDPAWQKSALKLWARKKKLHPEMVSVDTGTGPVSDIGSVRSKTMLLGFAMFI